MQELAEAIDSFVASYRNCDPQQGVTEQWTAKDVLGHVTYWHTYYADNLAGELAGESHVFPKIKYAELNRVGVEAMRAYSDETLLHMLRDAHQRLDACVRNSRVRQMTYRAGSQPYPLAEFLRVAISHIRGHTTALRKSASRRSRTTGAGNREAG